MKWTIGLVTSPRKHGYFLDHCLNSMKGMPTPVIFAEPKSIIPNDFTGNVVFRRKKFGDWTNWAVGLYELFLSEPDSDLFLMVEDDCVFCKNALPYLEYAINHIPDFSYISLYTGEEFHYPKIIGFHNECRGWETRSTVCVLLTRNKVENFLSNPSVVKHRIATLKTPDDNSSKDSLLGRWASDIGLPAYFHSPSLVDHIGWDSTLLWAVGKGYDESYHPRSKDFPGEDFDASQWIGRSPDVREFRHVEFLF